MERIIKLTNGRYIQADYSINHKKAYGHLQVMDIKEERGYTSRCFTMFEDPRVRYFLDDVPRKTKKAIGLIEERFINTLDSVLIPFLADNKLTIATD